MTALTLAALLLLSAPDAGPTGRAARQEEAWKTAPDRFPVGKKVKGRVNMIHEHGVFFELAPEVYALVHKTDLPPGKKPSDYTVGDQVELTVVKVDIERKRISGTIP